MTVNVLFVCLGNICRSPMAEAVFRRLVEQADLSEQIKVDSAGTGAWHVGQRAHMGTRTVLAQHGIQYKGRARKVQADDMADKSAYIVAMDLSNTSSLEANFGRHPRLFRLLEFAPQHGLQDVPDPYYSGNFERVYELVEDGCRGLLAMIIERENLGVQ